MFNLDRWLDKYIEAVDAAFGARIVFIGLQGSYARSEAHEDRKAWDKADLFQFCRDTKALYGDLEFIAFLTGEADAKRALHTAACNIYHACGMQYLPRLRTQFCA